MTITPTPSRHEAHCSICTDARREEIDQEFCDWKPLSIISRERKLSLPALYRHCHATGLFERRDANLKFALSRFIDRGYRVKVTANAFVAAIQVYSKLNASGQSVERFERVTTNPADIRALFARMNRGEMLRYAETGELPAWWPRESENEPQAIDEPKS
jgi:hypothetical protein